MRPALTGSGGGSDGSAGTIAGYVDRILKGRKTG
jgi:hypothetical protein